MSFASPTSSYVPTVECLSVHRRTCTPPRRTATASRESRVSDVSDVSHGVPKSGFAALRRPEKLLSMLGQCLVKTGQNRSKQVKTGQNRSTWLIDGSCDGSWCEMAGTCGNWCGCSLPNPSLDKAAQSSVTPSFTALHLRVQHSSTWTQEHLAIYYSISFQHSDSLQQLAFYYCYLTEVLLLPLWASVVLRSPMLRSWSHFQGLKPNS